MNNIPVHGLKPLPKRRRKPFWLPALSYYMLSAGLAIAGFFVVWGVLYEEEATTPWIIAGVFSGVFIVFAVILRELVLRRARLRYLAAQRELDARFYEFGAEHRRRGAGKITVEQNTAALNAIIRKSEAARILKNLVQGHNEVVSMCDEYLRIINSELPQISIGSPRLVPFQRGKTVVSELRHKHLLQAVEIESKALFTQAQTAESSIRKFDLLNGAISIIDRGITDYPNDVNLIDSKNLLLQNLKLTEIRVLIDQSDHQRAIGNRHESLRKLEEAESLVLQSEYSANAPDELLNEIRAKKNLVRHN